MLIDALKHRDDPPRILHLVHGLDFGGIENWLVTALQHAPRIRFVMDVCYKGSQEGTLADHARAAGARVVRCSLGPTVLPFISRLKRILLEGQYSLLHVHTHAHSGPAVYAAKTAGVPVVTTFHSTQRRPQTALTRLPGIRVIRDAYAHRSVRYALEHSNVSNGVSSAVAEAVTKGVGVSPSRCEPFYLGCERPKPISDERINQFRTELKLQKETPVIVHVGSFRACKNHSGLLETFRKVADALPNAVLLLIGDGPSRPLIVNRISQLGLESHVRLLGMRRDATQLMQLGDVFLFPSHYEGLSIALLEAVAVGVPVVASDIPGNREATCGGSFARLHEVADVDGMAKSAIDLLLHPSVGCQLGERGRAHFERVFSIEASINRLTTLYDSVLLSSPPRQGFASSAA